VICGYRFKTYIGTMADCNAEKGHAGGHTFTFHEVQVKTEQFDYSGDTCTICGGMIRVTGSCRTCSQCGANTGCG
jgi:hypothetical protein